MADNSSQQLGGNGSGSGDLDCVVKLFKYITPGHRRFFFFLAPASDSDLVLGSDTDTALELAQVVASKPVCCIGNLFSWLAGLAGWVPGLVTNVFGLGRLKQPPQQATNRLQMEQMESSRGRWAPQPPSSGQALATPTSSTSAFCL